MFLFVLFVFVCFCFVCFACIALCCCVSFVTFCSICNVLYLFVDLFFVSVLSLFSNFYGFSSNIEQAWSCVVSVYVPLDRNRDTDRDRDMET